MRTPRASVPVRELVGFLLRRGDLERRGGDPFAATAGAQAHALSARPAEPGYQAEVPLRVSVHAGGRELRVTGRADAVISSGGGVTIEEIKSTTARLESLAALREPDPLEALGIGPRPPGDPGGRLLDWAQAFCYAAMYRGSHGDAAVRVRLRYVAAGSGEALILERASDPAALRLFLEELACRYAGWVGRAEEWKLLRDASLAALAFPFPRLRPGQEELMEAVRGAVERGERLFLQAPTGIGKTMGVLLPALGSMGPCALRRILYLTPRGTAADPPWQALERLRRSGARVRAIALTAREKLCPCPGSGCLPDFCAFARGYYDRLPGALDELVGAEAIDARALLDCARKHTVCPHELGLDASLWCDVIVGDYNYLFDPRVALRRYLDPELAPAAEQLVLVDEAHNLVDRAREMLSSALESGTLEELARSAEPGAPGLAAAARAVEEAMPRAAEACEELEAAGDEAAGASTEPPRALAEPLEAFALAAEEWLDDPSGAPLPEELATLVFDTLFFRSILARFDSRYALLARSGREGLRLELRCLDPSPHVGERLGRARAAVLFSATLAPAEYYASLLGGGTAASTLALSPPFPRENLRVVVDRSVSTRYRDRAASLLRVARTVAAVASSRPGSYLVFAPSYEYLGALHDAYRRVAPGATSLRQEPGMPDRERREFLESVASFGHAALSREGGGSLAAFAVLGGLFGEGVDLPGEGLAGAVIVGVGLPQLSAERELLRAYFEERSGQGFLYAYAVPGIGRVLQAAGRVIRSDTDRGVVALVDERFAAPPYRELLPDFWEPLVELRGAKEIARELEAFWRDA